MLISAVNELARGHLSATTKAFIKSLEGCLDVSPTKKSVLFALNAYVAIYNLQEIANLPGNAVVYESKDTGNALYLNKIMVEKVRH